MSLVSLLGCLDHLRRAVNRRDPPTVEPITHQRNGHAVAAAHLEDAIVWINLEELDRPTESL
jgi:hypothetical protein